MRKNSIIIILTILFCISLIFNIYLWVTGYIESTYTPDSDDREVLAEMTKKVIESDEYKEIASREPVYAIEQGVSRFNVADPSSIYHYEIYVQTDKQSYIFTCEDEVCSEVDNGGWTYSRFSDKDPILPTSK